MHTNFPDKKKPGTPGLKIKSTIKCNMLDYKSSLVTLVCEAYNLMGLWGHAPRIF